MKKSFSTRVPIQAKKLPSQLIFHLSNIRFLSTTNKYKNLHSTNEGKRDQNFFPDSSAI